MLVVTRRRTRRTLLSLSAGILMVLLASQSVLAAVAWTKPVNAGPQYSWNLGRGLAMTETSSKTYLHVQFEDDGHKHTGIYYRRGNASGSSWGTAKRMNPASSDAEYGAIAAASKYVYVVYTTGSHAQSGYDPTDPRLLRVRINTNHGSSNAWLPTKKMDMFAHNGRPSVAASGKYAYVAVTDADTGEIHILTNNGANVADVGWLGQHIGDTTRLAVSATGDGFEGAPVVAASGARVMVAWIDSDAGTIKARISTDHGHTWPDPAIDLATGQVYGLSAAGDATRLALAWAAPDGIRSRVYRDGSWKATHKLASFSSTGAYRNGYGTSIALAGSSRLGVAWSACTRASCAGSSTQGVNVRWRESANNGSSWKSPVTIASHGAGSDRRINDYPSALMPDARHRLITYNTAARNFSTYRLVIERGTGKP